MNILKLFSTFFSRRILDKKEEKPSAGRASIGANLECDKMELARPLVVVDVGCRWGFAKKFTEKAGLFRIYGFDLDPDECNRLNHIYGNDLVTFIPLGLARVAGKKTLFVTAEPACSSLLKPDPALTERYPSLACAKHVSSIDVKTTTLDVWANDAKVETVDYLKIDTQGTELDILKGGISVLKSVRCLEVEVEFNPIYLEQPVFSDVDIFLRGHDFVLWKLTNQVHYSSSGLPAGPLGYDSVFYDDKCQVRHEIYGGQLYWANACYVRKDVLQPKAEANGRTLLDVVLFRALGMPDVVQHVLDAQSGVTRQR